MTAVDLPAVPRVLIAEADPWSRDLLKQVLLNVRCDARIDLCADGQQALSLLSEVPYDLAIVDWELPGIDGLSVLRSVRQRKRNPPLPFILMSSRNDSASVREALPLAPTAYLTKPLNMESLTERLQGLLLNAGEEVFCEVPALAPGMTLSVFLERRREQADGAPLMTDVQVAVKRSLNPNGLDLKLLEDEIKTDPQITAVLIAAANSAAQHHGAPVQTLAQALHRLGTGQSMNLILGLALKRSARLSDPCLADYAERYWGCRCTPLNMRAPSRGCSISIRNAVTARACCIAWVIWRCCVVCRSGNRPVESWMSGRRWATRWPSLARLMVRRCVPDGACRWNCGS